MTPPPFFFGYGSLVNRATHRYADAYPAAVTGWSRLWHHPAAYAVAVLTAIPDAGARIEGLIAAVPGGDWAELDRRERNYVRSPAGRVEHAGPPEARIAIYSVPGAGTAPAARTRPILLSYLDVVVEGYLAEYGEAGVARFFATTRGWDGPVLNDRAFPFYPRARTTTKALRALVDDHLARLNVRSRRRSA